jgi:hypothetical protein
MTGKVKRPVIDWILAGALVAALGIVVYFVALLFGLLGFWG